MTPGRRGAAALAGVVVLLCWAAGPAAAHSELVASDPANGASLPAAPQVATLTFNEAIAGEFTSVAVTIGVAAPAPAAATAAGPTVTVDLSGAVGAPAPDAPTPPGPVTWTIAYRVVSADGHPIQGQVAFTAPLPAAPTPTPAPSGAPTQTPSATPSPDPAPTAGDRVAGDGSDSSDEGGSATPWLAGGAVLVAAGAVGGVALARRRTVSS